VCKKKGMLKFARHSSVNCESQAEINQHNSHKLNANKLCEVHEDASWENIQRKVVLTVLLGGQP
jgi:hypothetical protein